MIDQLIIGKKASFDDFGASVSERQISYPKKKSIKKTVPFANVTYDFSKINGELYWEERTVEYIFEIMADTPELLEQKKQAFSNWVMNVMNEKIYDPFIPDFHYLGTYEDMSPEDDESLLKTTLTVKFTVYPYAIANEPKKYDFTITAGEEKTVVIVNGSSHRITPTFSTNAVITVKLDNVSYSVAVGETKDDSFFLKEGANTVTIKAGTDCTVTVSFIEEVF